MKIERTISIEGIETAPKDRWIMVFMQKYPKNTGVWKTAHWELKKPSIFFSKVIGYWADENGNDLKTGHPLLGYWRPAYWTELPSPLQ